MPTAMAPEETITTRCPSWRSLTAVSTMRVITDSRGSCVFSSMIELLPGFAFPKSASTTIYPKNLHTQFNHNGEAFIGLHAYLEDWEVLWELTLIIYMIFPKSDWNQALLVISTSIVLVSSCRHDSQCAWFMTVGGETFYSPRTGGGSHGLSYFPRSAKAASACSRKYEHSIYSSLKYCHTVIVLNVRYRADKAIRNQGYRLHSGQWLWYKMEKHFQHSPRAYDGRGFSPIQKGSRWSVREGGLREMRKTSRLHAEV